MLITNTDHYIQNLTSPNPARGCLSDKNAVHYSNSMLNLRDKDNFQPFPPVHISEHRRPRYYRPDTALSSGPVQDTLLSKFTPHCHKRQQQVTHHCWTADNLHGKAANKTSYVK